MHGGCQGSALASIPLALGTPALFSIQPGCVNPKLHPQVQRGDALTLVGNRKTPPQPHPLQPGRCLVTLGVEGGPRAGPCLIL